MNTYSNPDPRLHIDMLFTQFEILVLIKNRKLKTLVNNDRTEIKAIYKEIEKLNKIIQRKTLEKHCANYENGSTSCTSLCTFCTVFTSSN